MTQKLLKIGNEVAVKLPKASLRKLGLKAGDSVRVAVQERDRTVIVEPTAVVDREVLEWTKRFIKKYRPALEALARQ